MKEQMKRFLALMLLTVMVITVFAGCERRKTITTVTSEIEESVNPDGTTTPSTNAGQDGNSSSNINEEIVDESNQNGATNTESNQNGGNKVESNQNGGTNANTTDSKDNQKLAGTTVTYATWKDPQLNEDGIVVKSFEKKYNIKVKIDLIPQEKYIEILASRIAASKSPDICFDNGQFPNSLQVLQPLDAAKLDYSDPIWDNDFINHTTLNGKKYLVNTVSNIWNEYIVLYFNKKIFNNYGIKTPDQYYNEGNWTWDTMESVLKEIKQKAGKSINGAIIEQDKMLATLGTDFYKYDSINHKFSNGTKDKIFLPAMKKLAGWFIDGYINSGTFADGKTAMCVTDLFGLKKTGYWATMNTNDVGFTYVPNWDKNTKAKPAGIFRGWGLVKGATNPEGAGLFLRHYLDVNNYDTASAFISKEAETFFFKVSGISSANKVYCVSRGVSNLAGNTQTYSNEIALVYMSEINQVDKKIEEMQNKLNDAVKKSNDAIAKYTK